MKYSYNPEDSNIVEKEDMTVGDGIKESQQMTLFHRCHNCALEVKLETSVVGTLLVINGICNTLNSHLR